VAEENYHRIGEGRETEVVETAERGHIKFKKKQSYKKKKRRKKKRCARTGRIAAIKPSTNSGKNG